jgi:hypothetical protein
MLDYEKLGLFYLGRRVDPATGTTLDEPVLYDSRDLVTHAVCVGMTGSGKTGLCLNLIEEAAIDGVPVIAIDPKGDLGNLLLTFPGLSSEDFEPWIDPDEARRAGRDPKAYAAEEAKRWKEGLAQWGQDGARIKKLRESAEFAIYTPGSRAGTPVSILSSFAAPPAAAREDSELVAERAAGTATSLIALAGIDAPPRSREHTILATLLASSWREGKDLDLSSLIQQLQTPPFQKVGVVDLESFFPAKERFELAMKLNGLLAAPGFEQWLEGASLDPATLIYTADGRPRVAIFSIAHLGDAERMFFVSLLLNNVVSWMRRQTGTASLRAILYMDEIMGYFPPVANPPSKQPLLTILKQGRAFGIGAVLATQNPVDLDYKGLANTGTWFLGRLQTDRDKQRVLDGLEGAAAGSIDRAEADRLLSSLGKRVFLLHNVHDDAPLLFQTRWTMSYLRGPMSREQIRQASGRRETVPEARGTRVAPAAAPVATARESPTSPKPATRVEGARPVVPPDIQQFFIPPSAGGRVVRYRPMVLGAAQVRFSDSKTGIESTRDILYAAPLLDAAVAVDWDAVTPLTISARDLQREPADGAAFAEPPDAALKPRNYSTWEKDFSRHAMQNERIELFSHRELKLSSKSGESEHDFAARVRQALREVRDEAVEAIRKKYGTRQAQIADQLRRAEGAVARESEQASQAKLQTGVSMGAAVLGALFGRKTASVGNLGRATTAARGVGRSMKEAEDVKRASDNVEAIREKGKALQEELAHETQAIAERYDAAPEIERLALSPKRGQVSVQFVALGWMPEGGDTRP